MEQRTEAANHPGSYQSGIGRNFTQAAIYLTVKFELLGKKTSDGKILQTQTDVNSYILNEAKIAVVPFYAFGASKDSYWYRLSVGTCKKEEIDEMLHKLELALSRLS